MYAVKLKAEITADHQIHLQLPADTPVSSAEVIVLIESQPPVGTAASLEGFLERLDRSERPRLSAAEVDRWIEEERNAWE